jgi:hypothetical protein
MLLNIDPTNAHNSRQLLTIVDIAMNLSHPPLSIIPSLTGYVLEVLAETTRPLAGREVQRLLGRKASPQAVQRILDALAVHGVVIQQEAGQAILNSLNREHILYPVIQALGAVRQSVYSELQSIVHDEAPAVHKAVVFGSVLSRTATEHSDVDLLLVWPDGTPEVERDAAGEAIAQRVLTRFGNPCHPLHYAAAEFDQLAEVSPNLAQSIGDAHVDLFSGRVGT